MPVADLHGGVQGHPPRFRQDRFLAVEQKVEGEFLCKSIARTGPEVHIGPPGFGDGCRELVRGPLPVVLLDQENDFVYVFDGMLDGLFLSDSAKRLKVWSGGLPPPGIRCARVAWHS